MDFLRSDEVKSSQRKRVQPLQTQISYEDSFYLHKNKRGSRKKQGNVYVHELDHCYPSERVNNKIKFYRYSSI